MANPTDKVNDVSNFVRAKGKTEIIEVLFSASVAAEEGSLVYPNPSAAGQFTKADATAGNAFGVIRQTIASTDSDYASTKLVKVEVPRENNVEWYFTVGAGTFTQADEWKLCDLNSEKDVAVDTQSKLVIYISKYISSTRGKCILAGNLWAWVSLPATS